MSNDVTAAVRAFIDANFMFREDCAALDDGESLLDAGLIDSTGVLELVAFLEQTFGITIADQDIVPDNLDSVSAIVAFVRRQTGEAEQGPAVGAAA